MPRGAKLTPEVDKIIAEACIQHPEWISKPAKIQQWVIAQLPESLKLWGGPNWPGKDVIQDRLRKTIRPNLEGRAPEVKLLDKFWSMGAFDVPGSGISPEAANDLIEVWKYCLAIGHIFTIREAKWVNRLRIAVKAETRRTGYLFAFAYEYAIRERISEILKTPMDTRDLDGRLSDVHYDWDYAVFRSLNMIPRLTLDFRTRNDLLPQSDRSVSYFASQAASIVAEQHMPPDADRDIRVLNPITGYSYGLSQVQDRACAAMLLFLSKGPLWNTISLEEYMSILGYLKELVTKEMGEVETIVHKNLDFSNYKDRPNGLTPEDVLSVDLLKRVGYEVVTHEQTIDNPYPNLKELRHVGRYKAVYKAPGQSEGGIA